MAWNRLARQLLRDERGTSAVELALICALIVLAMMTALQGFANENNKTWNFISNSMANADRKSVV